MEDSKRQEDGPPPRKWAASVGAVAVFLGLAVMMFYWLKPPTEATRAFEVPKITIARLDEQPFMRMELGPGESYRPIDVMAGTTVTLDCQVVSRAAPGTGKSRFLLKAFGREREMPECLTELEIPDEVGREENLVIIFFDAGAKTATDVLTVPMVIRGRSEGIEFHALEDELHRPVSATTAPDQVFVYARAITRLPSDTRDYAAMFFTMDPTVGVPVLELAPVHEGERPQPLVSSLIRFRSYGKDLAAYAFWTPSPIRLGGRDGSRMVTDIGAFIVRKDQIATLFPKLLKVEQSGPDTLTVTPLVQTLEELRSMAVLGLVSRPPLHVLRAPGPAAEAQVPGATSPAQP